MPDRSTVKVKLLVYLCNQIDFEKAENPIHVGIEEFSNNYIIPGLTAASFVAMIDSLAQRGFWLRKEDGTTCLVRIIDKAECTNVLWHNK